ncbi:hypothetical protein SARC_05780 [Sphaeroforma arctica JP610]|uniref:Uncharacterized protein n=1 Tax=Sphaeroforma arctica JP610 TaxID=667725 RepID=A0A0L0FYM2_9EUKA|nr:hypothetical protein SARC_05780 [Sphaeroforma arctica JP610]KNC81930.1 hypothetical protein SARC_05780 [Sphaeroforma arctica JP610]|eukprot:XP_014155832.1 hypothetical protein SARC_05780 [Sphaeroforma arctica JP610]
MRKGKKPERFLIILAVCLFLVYKRIPFSCDSSLGNGYIRSVSNALCTDNPNTQGDGEIGLAGNDTNAEGLQQRVPPGSRGKIKYTDNGDGSDSIRSSRESSEERGGQAVVADKSGQRDMRPEAIQGSDRSAHKAEGTWEVGGDGVIDRTDTISDIDDARDEAKELTQANSKETRTSDLNVYSGTCLHNAKERDPINSRVLVDKVAEASKECPILPFHIKQPGEGHDCVPFPDTYTYDVPLLDPHLFHYKNKRFEGVVGHGTVKAFVLSTAYCDLPVIVARQIQNVGSYWAGAKKSLIARGYRHYPQRISAGEAYCQLLQIREANADLTMKQRSQLKSQWLGQWEKTMRATFVKETNSHRALLSRLTPPGRKK